MHKSFAYEFAFGEFVGRQLDGSSLSGPGHGHGHGHEHGRGCGSGHGLGRFGWPLHVPRRCEWDVTLVRITLALI